MPQVLSSRTQQEKTSLLRNRDYRLLWIGQTLSFVGDSFFSATIAIWIIDKLARPYMPRLSNFRRLTCPSPTPWFYLRMNSAYSAL